MDVLRPGIVHIGTRCYRRNPVQKRETNTAEEEDYTVFTADAAGWDDETCTLDATNLEQTADGYKVSIPAPSQLFKFVIGRKAETKTRLETETRTKIMIPRQGQTGDIVIQGHDRNGVISAKTRVEVLLDSGRQKQPFTHFLSIPVTQQHIQEAMADFKSDVLRDCDGDRGLDASIFQNPSKMHITIGCLVLLDKDEIQRAADVLQQCKHELVHPILRSEPLQVTFAGLEYMNDDPAAVDVLYIQVDDPSDRLQILVDRLVDRFTSTGLMQREFDRVKLHATVMNTVFRKDPSGTTESDQGKRRARESFDATQLLQKFGRYKFGDYQIDEVQLSQRHSFTGAGGYYTSAGSLDLT